MSHSCYSPRTWYRGAFRVGLGFCLLGCLSLVLATKASAQEAVFVTGVEEDWELVVETPDPNLNGPQVTCSIAPNANDDSLYAAFELNHRTLPDFERGGMQLQVWSSEFNLANNPYPQYQLLSTAGETVTWTMSMRLQGENITFEV